MNRQTRRRLPPVTLPGFPAVRADTRVVTLPACRVAPADTLPASIGSASLNHQPRSTASAGFKPPRSTISATE